MAQRGFTGGSGPTGSFKQNRLRRMFENEINWLDKYFGENSLSTEDYKKHDYRNDKNILNVIEHYDSQKFKCRTIHFEPFNEINEWALKSLFISNPNLRYYIDTKFHQNSEKFGVFVHFHYTVKFSVFIKLKNNSSLGR